MKISSFIIYFLFFCSSAIAQTWPQIGQDIDGEAMSDQAGTAVCFNDDGSILAIGSPYNDGNGTDAGSVRVFQNISGIWTQIGGDIDGEAANDNFGIAVSLSADGLTVAVGAYRNDGNGTDAGHVRVFQYISGIWTQIGGDIDGEAAGDNFGCAVSISSNGITVAVGANQNDGNGSSSGHVRVFEYISGTWTQIGSDIDGEAFGDLCGNAVSISNDGTIVAAGARFNDGNGSNAGHVRVFENIAGTWTQIGNDMDGEAANDYSGCSVSLSADGTVVAIGADRNDGNGSEAGHVRVYENVSGTWTQVGNDLDGEATNNYSGLAVSLSDDGTIVAIGAPFNDGSGNDAGHVRVYQNISGTWNQLGSDIEGEMANSRSGSSVSLSADGSFVAIGAPLNSGKIYNAGHVRVYRHIAPAITIQPLDQTSICPEEIVDFTISGNYITKWEWQVSDGGPWVTLSNDAVYSGTNTGTLHLISDIDLNNNQYRCIVSNAFGQEISNAAVFHYTGVSNPNPVDMSIGVSFNADISWNSSPDALSYDVYFGEKGVMQFIGNQTGLTYDPGTLLYSTEYDWTIYPVTTEGTVYCDKVWRFTTELNASPPEGIGISVNDTGDEPNVYAMLDVNISSHNKGILIPRLTSAQRTGLNLMGPTEEGLTVYDSDTDSFWFWDGTQWNELAVTTKESGDKELILNQFEELQKEIQYLKDRLKDLEDKMDHSDK